MGKYLDKFRGTLNQRQADQVFKLLNKQRNLGQIRSIEEFTRRLDTLIRELTGTVMQPTLKVFQASEGSVASSEQFNFMLDRTQDDLSAGFEEALNIDEVQVSHEALVRDVILKNLRAGVAELESKIGLYEFLNKDPRGFDSSIFSTFRESKEERTSRGLPETSSLFVDPRTGVLFPTSEDATIELIGERLTLATSQKDFHPIHDIRQVFDATSPQTDKIVTPPGMDLRNVIDDTNGTFWSQSWLFPTKQSYVKIQLELDLGVTREINFIEIEPVSTTGFFLEAVHYLDGSNVYQNLNLPEHFLTGTAGLRIKKTATRRLIFTFRSENGQYTNFEFTNQDTLLNQSQSIKKDKLVDPTSAAMSADLSLLVSSQKVKDIIGIQTETPQIYNGYEFTIGFDNIRVGLAQYESSSVYVSTPLDSSSAAVVGLRALESRPYIDPVDGLVKFTSTTYDGDDNIYYIASIEYWLTKQDLDADGNLVRTTVFPIMPLETGRVMHERLILTEKSVSTLAEPNIGDLMFYTTYDLAHPTLDGNIIVYRNGVPLPNVDADPLAVDGWCSTETSDADRTPDALRRMRFRIKIIGGLIGDIYTVSYTPMVSTTTVIPQPPYTTLDYRTGLQIVDLVGDLSARVGEGQAIFTEALGGSKTIASSKYYCAIILRQNTADPTVSPAVEEYTLFAGRRDTTKFSGV
jgi:hypothetical protein